ncbi:hypothetical protein SPV1_11621 [Mariprofundus ferrooxydans PV-1]|uniref:Uncharacterized protein n=1 Tax=Mariprofundus ferrooxydans PV-1 TaxID=314345 RepID=Q0F112_9PROT|nr:hypothetical protein SPV1_11621 [Mariprofundus ferrooxydans PV-1]
MTGKLILHLMAKARSLPGLGKPQVSDRVNTPQADPPWIAITL